MFDKPKIVIDPQILTSTMIKAATQHCNEALKRADKGGENYIAALVVGELLTEIADALNKALKLA